MSEINVDTPITLNSPSLTSNSPTIPLQPPSERIMILARALSESVDIQLGVQAPDGRLVSVCARINSLFTRTAREIREIPESFNSFIDDTVPDGDCLKCPNSGELVSTRTIRIHPSLQNQYLSGVQSKIEEKLGAGFRVVTLGLTPYRSSQEKIREPGIPQLSETAA